MFGIIKRCPYCKEWVRKKAIRCKHCHSSIGVDRSSASQNNDEGIRYLQNGFGKIKAECDAIEGNMKMRTGFIFVKHQYSSDDLLEAVEKIDSFVEKMRSDLELWEAANKLTIQVKSLFDKRAGEVYQRLEYLQMEIERRTPTWWEKVKIRFRRIFEKLFSFFSFKMIAGRKNQNTIAA